MKSASRLVDAVQRLSLARDVGGVAAVVRDAARGLTGADGATLVLREGDLCHYVDEDAIAPLWKGRRLPIERSVSGWVIQNRAPAVIEDVLDDERVPAEVFKPTFVKSLAVVPIRAHAPVGAIGSYWAERHRATDEELWLLRVLADSAAAALENLRLYEELERRVVELDRAVHARDTFVAIAAHALKTPLTPLRLQIESALELVRARADGSAEAGEPTEPTEADKLGAKLESASRQVDRLGLLVGNLLDLTHIAFGRAGPRDAVGLRALVTDVIERSRPLVDRLDTPITLVDGAEVVGHWNRLRIELAVENVLSNALKFGEGKPVTIAIDSRDEIAELFVRDRGIGIAREHQSRIFEQFERAVPANHFGGLGLGLWVTRKIVEEHGGAIRVESENGRGSTFTLELPFARPEAHQ
ncbi:MAG: GAF domain-containing sensor histidine kinase [Labilithrix sp.]|nr:GAF domain-containing sensor histidine kinase [Labilithrix sp.]MCW5832843.1 GAF domain-containing sensor histidine kinase [Labilithrix sp.]